jgi:hypothetical protein
VDIKQVNEAIIFGQFTDIELNSILDAVRFRRTSMQKRMKYVLKQGQMVRWNSARRGIPAEGEIRKIGHKFATVQEGVRLWKVPMNMLEVI